MLMPSKVFNSWRIVGMDAVLTVKSTKHGVIEVWTDRDIVDQLKEFTWCWWPEKQQLYATDLSADGDKCTLINSGRRILLWKWICYLKYGSVIPWVRFDTLEYRWRNGYTS